MSQDGSIVFIIDDDEQVRDSFANLCRSVDLNVRTYASIEEFTLAERPPVPSCMVLDVRFPASAPSGLDFQRGLDASNSPPIIFVTGHGDIQMSVQAMKLGALEFLTKPVREQELLDAIRRGIEWDRRRLHEANRLTALRKRYDGLTEREREIMMLVTQGNLNKQIAAAIGRSEVTVKAHRGRIMHKMGAHSLADLVRMSDQLGEIRTRPAPPEVNDKPHSRASRAPRARDANGSRPS